MPRTKAVLLSLALVMVVAGGLPTPPAAHAQRQGLRFEDTFDTGFKMYPKNDPGWTAKVFSAYSPLNSTWPTRSGAGSERVELRRTDLPVPGTGVNGTRSELALGSELLNADGQPWQGEGRWYGFSTYLPPDYVPDNSVRNNREYHSAEIVAQWHQTVDNGLSPPPALLTRNGRWWIDVRWEANPDGMQFDLGPYKRGASADRVKPEEWTDWVFRVLWRSDYTGQLEVWKNRQLVLTRYLLPNCYADQHAYLQFGCYKWDFAKDQRRSGQEPPYSRVAARVLYHDEVRVGDVSATFLDVTPDKAPVSVIREHFTSAASAANFTVVGGGAWGVSNGKYLLTQPRAGFPNGNLSVHKTDVRGDFVLTAEARATATGGPWDDFSIVFCYQNPQNYYFVSFNENNDPLTSGIFKVVGGRVTQIADITEPVPGGASRSITIQRIGSGIHVYSNNAWLATGIDPTFTYGKVGFGTRDDGGSFDNLMVRQ